MIIEEGSDALTPVKSLLDSLARDLLQFATIVVTILSKAHNSVMAATSAEPTADYSRATTMEFGSLERIATMEEPMVTGVLTIVSLSQNTTAQVSSMQVSLPLVFIYILAETQSSNPLITSGKLAITEMLKGVARIAKSILDGNAILSLVILHFARELIIPFVEMAT